MENIKKLLQYARDIWRRVGNSPITASVIEFIKSFVTKHPLITLIIAGAIAALLLIYLPGWNSPAADEGYIKKQIEAKERATELEIKAREYEVEAKINRERAVKAEKKLGKTSKTIKRKKEYAQKKHKETVNSGHRTIDVDDIPSNFELCTRANSLNIRCDFDK